MVWNTAVNRLVRAGRGGKIRAAALTRVLERDGDVARHCDEVLAGPMPDDTFEALTTAIGRRHLRGVPGYLVTLTRPPLPRGRKRQYPPRERRNWVTLTRVRARARLVERHREEYEALLLEEREREPFDTYNA